MNNSIPSEQAHLNAARQWQEHVQNNLNEVGARVPPPILGQTTNDYIRETCRTLKRTFLPQNHPLYAVQWRDREGLRSDALQVLVPQLLDACVKNAHNPRTVPPGEFREIVKTLPNGYKEHTFVGSVVADGEQDCFVRHPEYGHRAGRTIKSFWAPADSQGRSLRPYDSSGGPKEGWVSGGRLQVA
jgi:hypothetical protein